MRERERETKNRKSAALSNGFVSAASLPSVSVERKDAGFPNAKGHSFSPLS